jgi:hypothetical protein
MHSFDDREQRELVGTPLSGEFPRKATANPQVGLYFNDATGSKMSYFLDYDAQVSASSCSAGRQQLNGHLTIGSHPPADQGSLPTSVTGGAVHGVPAGSQLVVAEVYGPVGGRWAASRSMADGCRARSNTTSVARSLRWPSSSNRVSPTTSAGG